MFSHTKYPLYVDNTKDVLYNYDCKKLFLQNIGQKL